MIGLVATGWEVRALIPNGWFPPMAWRLAPAWRAACARALPANWSLDGISIGDLRFQNRVPSRLSKPLSLVGRVELALRKELASAAHRPGILLVQFALPHGSAVRASAISHGIPYAVHLRGDDVWIWPHERADRMLAFQEVVRDAALVIGVSRNILVEAQRLVGPQPIRGAVVPNGIDTRAFSPVEESERQRLRETAGIRAEQLVVLCVAPQLVAKGWPELLNALGELPYDRGRIVLHCVSSSLRDEIDVPAEAARRAPNVQVLFERDVPRHRMPDLFRMADVFALPSRSEGMSNAVLEAMASGVAVLTTRVGGHAEVIEDGSNGRLVPPGDVRALREALETLLISPSDRESLGSAARSRAERIGDSLASGRTLARLLEAVFRRDLNPDLLDEDPYSVSTDLTCGRSQATIL
ncbi:MAG TPA: glycosyltransferase [Gemmatimonadaceae bacterium]|nr:glycosyltransferase [Gemmatimonadaceae bacterium]